MPGSATHIAVADRIYSALGSSVIINLPLFFSGNIAPDAVHARDGYKREDKRRSHLTVDMPIDSFHDPEKLKIYHERINQFIAEFYDPSDERRDLYLGYVVHLLVDELFNVTLRTPLCKLMFMETVPQEEHDFFERVMQDIDSIDKLILRNYAYEQNVAEVLEVVWDYEIPGYVSIEEINKSKRGTIGRRFKREQPEVHLKYFSYQDALNFIGYAADNIISMLSSKSGITKIL